jgi:hypothetical protein
MMLHFKCCQPDDKYQVNPSAKISWHTGKQNPGKTSGGTGSSLCKKINLPQSYPQAGSLCHWFFSF